MAFPVEEMEDIWKVNIIVVEEKLMNEQMSGRE